MTPTIITMTVSVNIISTTIITECVLDLAVLTETLPHVLGGVPQLAALGLESQMPCQDLCALSLNRPAAADECI